MSDTIKLNLTNTYEDEDTIEDEDEDDINENSDALTQELPNDEFCNHITQSKYKLYEIIVLGPNEESKDAQDNTLLEKYIKELDLLGKFIIKVINRPTELISQMELNKNYSNDTVGHVNDILNYTNAFLKNNSNINKMLYINYINNQFSIYPFFQLPYFQKYE